MDQITVQKVTGITDLPQKTVTSLNHTADCKAAVKLMSQKIQKSTFNF